MTSTFSEPLRLVLAELLHCDPVHVSASSNFAELGMDSLVALRFTRKINDVTGLDIELENLFDYPTIAALSSFLMTKEQA